MAEQNLTERQATVLRTIARLEYPTVREIAEAAGLARSSAHTVAMSLVRLGLAELAGVAASGGTTWALTEAGRQTEGS